MNSHYFVLLNIKITLKFTEVPEELISCKDKEFELEQTN